MLKHNPASNHAEKFHGDWPRKRNNLAV